MSSLLALLAPIEAWIGLILSLLTLSLAIRENIFSRLAQYILVGAVAGYLGVIAIHDILRPYLLQPVIDNPLGDLTLLVIFALGLLMLVTATVRIVQVETTESGRIDERRAESIVQRIFFAIGTIPVLLLLGAGLASIVTGMIQGTLLPQFWRAAEAGFAWTGSIESFVSGTITLLVTIGVFLHLYAAPAIQPTEEPTFPTQSELPEQLRMTQLQSEPSTQGPSIFGRIILLWAGTGKRILWFAAGVLFARLVASRLSLLIAQFEQIDSVLKGTRFWQAFVNLIQ